MCPKSREKKKKKMKSYRENMKHINKHHQTFDGSSILPGVTFYQGSRGFCPKIVPNFGKGGAL
jgi:hypothetical protein